MTTDTMEKIKNTPEFCLGGIEAILKTRHYKTDHQKIIAIEKHMKEFYILKGWNWRKEQ